ncbi:type II toxin-antitoxin system RelE/ParE family toxin [Serratia marcescens]|uniref:type II toxin-antitoxin system RelE/ParE family toxin n=1 Tax=Serratia marcescens TaxID=615 RepID=UPI0011E88637|nr:type II toxin-antitoxin system RelE/ParE family toxin [Serratia marcescens]
MPQEIRFTVAPAAEWSLKDIESYKSGTIGAVAAGVFVDNLLLSSLAAIADDPARYRFNAVLAGMGVRLHERWDPDSEYRVIYDYDGQTVEILLFISMKQDLESALYRYLLLQ